MKQIQTQYLNDYTDNPSFMPTLEEFSLKLEALAKDYLQVDTLKRILAMARGVNQTLAMECDNLMPGFISPRNPVSIYSVLPSQTNYKLTLEELSRLQIGGIAALAGLLLAFLYKVIKWFNAWRKGGDEGGDGGGGESGDGLPGGKGYLAPAKASGIINGAADVARDIAEMRNRIRTAVVQANSESASSVDTALTALMTKAYEPVIKRVTKNVEDFMSDAGAPAQLKAMLNGSLKEAPVKIADATAKLMELSSAVIGTSDVDQRIAQMAKLTDYRIELEGKKSLWLTDNGGDAVEYVRAVKEEFVKGNTTGGKFAADKMSVDSLILKLRNSFHQTYESFDTTVATLTEGIVRVLVPKTDDLKKRIEKDMSHLNLGDQTEDFKKDASDILKLIVRDTQAAASVLQPAKMLADQYAAMVKALPEAHDVILKEYLALARKAKNTALQAEVTKLMNTNKAINKKIS